MKYAHYRDIRLKNNAGINYPYCMAMKDEPIDTEHDEIVISDKILVDCPKCIKLSKVEWFGPLGMK
tara:strand:+ start:510 stop:707 length:198 start_codon:yes stop_codon:yes gene_type:complete